MSVNVLNEKLSRDRAGLLVVDVQDNLFSKVDRSNEVLKSMMKIIKGFQILQLPIVVTEQYPQGLGETVAPLKAVLGAKQQILTKTTFSCIDDEAIRKKVLESPVGQWLLVGIEAHICILQTAKDLLAANKQVVVLNDAISSQSIYDFSTAIAELRDCGVRISSTETVLFELLRDSKVPEFKQISQLVQCNC